MKEIKVQYIKGHDVFSELALASESTWWYRET
jgi:hypothetical protein